MKNVQWFMALGLVAIGVLVGVMIPRGEDRPGAQAGAGMSMLPPIGKPSIVGKWVFNKPAPDKALTNIITLEFLSDGTFIRSRQTTGEPVALPLGEVGVPPVMSDRDIGTWKEIEGKRLLVNYQGNPNGNLYSYSIVNDVLKIDGEEPQGGPYIDGFFNRTP